MNLTNVTITAAATKNFQKYEVSLTADNLVQGDIEKLKNYAISEAKKGIELLVEGNEQPEVKTTISEQPKQEYQHSYKRPYQTNKPVVENGSTGPKPITDAQKNMLKRLRYNGDIDSLSAAQAFKLIENLKNNTYGA